MKNPLPRPAAAPRKIPLWAWHLSAWLDRGRKGPRPHHAPRRVPAWFWAWRLWTLARARGKGSRAWKKYKRTLTVLQAKTGGEKVADTARHLAALYGPDMPYTETQTRDDWLIAAANPPRPPIRTDCSGFVTLCYWINKLPDPNGLGYRWLGWTGTVLAFAAKHGTVTHDVSRAEPGDVIVIGPAPGLHEVVCLERGPDPLVATHGRVGVQIQRLSTDTREPKTVCKLLPS